MSITIKIKGLDKLKKKLKPQVYRKIVNSALNTTVRKTKTEASKEIRKIYNIRAKDLNKNRRLSFQLSRLSNLKAVLFAKSRHLSLSLFGAVETKKIKGGGRARFKRVKEALVGQRLKSKVNKGLGGVTVKVKKTGARKFLPGAFLARTKSGHIGVFFRGTKDDGRSRKESVPRRVKGSQLPIDERVTVSVAEMMNNQIVKKKIIDKAKIINEEIRKKIRKL